MLGGGNDDLVISGSLRQANERPSARAKHGTLTIVQGGGNSLEGDGISVGADKFYVTGGGGPGSPLVIFGDTSQDGLWYSGDPSRADRNDNLTFGPKLFDQVGTADDLFQFARANPYTLNGNDVIDAHELDLSHMVPLNGTVTVGLIVYGGGGNDTIKGSQAGDHLAGGSGDDTIEGNGGDDHIYGDSGFNVDPITRTLFVVTSVNATYSPAPPAVRDALLAGQDNIKGGSGDDIIFGDHGIVTQAVPPRSVYPNNLTWDRDSDFDSVADGKAVIGTFGTDGASIVTGFDSSEKLLTTGLIDELTTDQASNGALDTIHGDDGRDRIFGGNADDTIYGDGGSDLIFGDHGRISYVAADYYGTTTNDDRSTLDLIVSLDVNIGGPDTIDDDGSDDIIVGGQGADVITAGAGQNIVFGDHGKLLGVDTGVNQPIGESGKIDDDYQMQVLGLVTSIDTGVADGGGDQITTGVGRDIIFGGQGDDTIKAYADKGGIAADDGNNIVFGDYGLIDYLAEESAYASPIIPQRTNDIDRIWSIDTGLGGNDDITTGNRNDIILAGADVDTVKAGDGNNIVFGDSGQVTAAASDAATEQFSVHQLTLGLVETLDSLVGAADNITTGIGKDIIFGGIAGDTIVANGDETRGADGYGNDQNNIVFGDSGYIDWTAEDPKRIYADTTVGPDASPFWGKLPGDDTNASDIDRIRSTEPGDGGVDTITTGDHHDIVIGGAGSDTVHAHHGKNIVFGDAGQLTAATTDDPLVQISASPFTIGELVSFAYAEGAADTIDSGDHDDILIGGAAGDTLDAGKGDNVVFGDHGQILMLTNLGVNNVVGTPRPDGDHPLTFALITSIVPDR